jgi:outer membrane protein assembly factor BamB
LRIKALLFIVVAASLGGVIAWMFKSSQDEIDKIRSSTTKIRSDVVWIKKIFHAGQIPLSYGTLTDDNIKDVIVSSGELNIGRGPKILALNGKTGKMLWSRRFSFSLSHQPVVIDINQDEIDDILVSGDSDNIFALNGLNGEVLWDLNKSNPDRSPEAKGKFSHITLISDLNADGTQDLFIVQSTDKIHSIKNKFSWLYKINSSNGLILQIKKSASPYTVTAAPSAIITADSPSVVLAILHKSKISQKNTGALLSINLKTLDEQWVYDFGEKEKLFRPITILKSKSTSGPVVFANNGKATVVKINGTSGHLMWKRKHKDIKSMSASTPGQFNLDPAIDLVLQLSKTEGKVIEGFIVKLDGDTGDLISEKSFEKMASSSPLTVDFNHDGYDETVVLANDTLDNNVATQSVFSIFDGKKDKLSHTISFSGFAPSTPTLHDLDGDGNLDLLINVQGQVFRIELKHSHGVASHWSQQHGPFNNGSF